ncbi:MAG TPA: condensation domain-containing protein [Pseudonocardiaceae bacterium]|nr:condensation domain-containing protein [Pseudonocardiaceae bacterium]
MVPFQGVGAGVGELSWGQAEIWSAIVAQESSLHLGGVAEFPVPKSLDEIVAALSWMISRHPALRTRLRFDPDGVRQVVGSDGEVPLRVVDVDDDVDPAKAAADMETEFRSTDFDYEREWPVRAAVIRRHGVATHLVAVYSHVILDLAGMQALFRNGLYTLLFTDGEADLPQVDSFDPLAQVAWQRGTAGHRHNKAVQRYWRRQVADIPAARFGASTEGEQPRHWQATMRSAALPAALRSIVARTSTDSSAILLAAAATALVHVTGRGPAVFQIIVSNRFRPGFADAVGTVAQSCLCVIDVADASFDEVIERAARSAMKAYLNAYFDRDAMSAMIDELGQERGEPIELTCFFNDRRAPDNRTGSVRPATATETTVHWGPHSDKPFEPLFVHVNDVAPDVIEILLQADTQCVSPEGMRTFLAIFEATLLAAAQSSQTR